eukprot:TRINITY_DN3604_c0_g1_i4.p1 TRINITY_DN3604_c0_g1~~TRINITY_DN3604_c0_g1_i4.p1  ORF type:complete len:1340 (+),score=417.67 TRINITY_DN3604_c0_g1_i4:1137-5156(+)
MMVLKDDTKKLINDVPETAKIRTKKKKSRSFSKRTTQKNSQKALAKLIQSKEFPLESSENSSREGGSDTTFSSDNSPAFTTEHSPLQRTNSSFRKLMLNMSTFQPTSSNEGTNDYDETSNLSLSSTPNQSSLPNSYISSASSSTSSSACSSLNNPSIHTMISRIEDKNVEVEVVNNHHPIDDVILVNKLSTIPSVNSDQSASTNSMTSLSSDPDNAILSPRDGVNGSQTSTLKTSNKTTHHDETTVDDKDVIINNSNNKDSNGRDKTPSKVPPIRNMVSRKLPPLIVSPHPNHSARTPSFSPNTTGSDVPRDVTPKDRKDKVDKQDKVDKPDKVDKIQALKVDESKSKYSSAPPMSRSKSPNKMIPSPSGSSINNKSKSNNLIQPTLSFNLNLSQHMFVDDSSIESVEDTGRRNRDHERERSNSDPTKLHTEAPKQSDSVSSSVKSPSKLKLLIKPKGTDSNEDTLSELNSAPLSAVKRIYVPRVTGTRRSSIHFDSYSNAIICEDNFADSTTFEADESQEDQRTENVTSNSDSSSSTTTRIHTSRSDSDSDPDHANQSTTLSKYNINNDTRSKSRNKIKFSDSFNKAISDIKRRESAQTIPELSLGSLPPLTSPLSPLSPLTPTDNTTPQPQQLLTQSNPSSTQESSVSPPDTSPQNTPTSSPLTLLYSPLNVGIGYGASVLILKLQRLYLLEANSRTEGAISRLYVMPNRSSRLSKLDTTKLFNQFKLIDVFNDPTLYFHFENFVKETHCEWAFYFIVENELFKTSIYRENQMKWFAEEIGKRWFGPHSPIFDEDLTFYFNQVKKRLTESNISLDMFDMIAESDIRPIMETKFVEFHDWYLNLELQRREMMLSTQRALQKQRKLRLKLKLSRIKSTKNKMGDRFDRLYSDQALLSDFLDYLRDRYSLNWWYLQEEIKEFVESDFDSKDAIHINATRIASKYILHSALPKDHVVFGDKHIYENVKELLKSKKDSISLNIFDNVSKAVDVQLRKMFTDFWKTRVKLFKSYGVNEEEEEKSTSNNITNDEVTSPSTSSSSLTSNSTSGSSGSLRGRAKIQASYDKLSATFSSSTKAPIELNLKGIQKQFAGLRKNKQLLTKFEDYLIERNSIQWLSLADDIQIFKTTEKRYETVIHVTANSLANKYLLNAPTSVFRISFLNTQLVEDLRKALKKSPVALDIFNDIEMEVQIELKELYFDFCWDLKCELPSAKKFDVVFADKQKRKSLISEWNTTDLYLIYAFCCDVHEFKSIKPSDELIQRAKEIGNIYLCSPLSPRHMNHDVFVQHPCSLLHLSDPVLLAQVRFRLHNGQYSSNMFDLLFDYLKRHLVMEYVDSIEETD